MESGGGPERAGGDRGGAAPIPVSRIRDWKIGLADTIADNASSGGVVLRSTPSALTGDNLRLAGCNLYRNGSSPERERVTP